jgi:ABC-type amino acid transport substrate-binding protein
MKRFLALTLSALFVLLSFTACGDSADSADKTLNVTSVDQLKDLKIGTQGGSAALETLEACDAYDTFSANITEYATYDEAILDLQTGRIDCIVVDEVLGEYKNSKLTQKLFLCDYNFGDDYYAIGCRREEADLAAKITEAIDTLISNGEAAKISEKWFGRDIVISEGYDDPAPIEGTTGWDYIQERGKLIIGLDDTFAPMGFRDENNDLVGFDIDLAKAVGEVLGIEIEFLPIDWTAGSMALKAKTVDCLWNGMSATPTREKEMALTNKYLNNRIVIMTLDKDN